MPLTFNEPQMLKDGRFKYSGLYTVGYLPVNRCVYVEYIDGSILNQEYWQEVLKRLLCDKLEEFYGIKEDTEEDY